MPSKGYTMVELMLVVSIILLLVAVSAMALGTARQRNDDDYIKNQLNLMRVEAESSYRINRHTRFVCGDIATTSFDVVATLPVGTTFKCLDGARGYAFEAVLSNGDFYCVDNVGREYESTSTSLIAGGGDCDGVVDCDCRP